MKEIVWFNLILILAASIVTPPAIHADPPGGSTATDTYQVYSWQYNVGWDSADGYAWEDEYIALMQESFDSYSFFVFRLMDHNATDIKTATLSFYTTFDHLSAATYDATIYGIRENDTDPLTLDPLPGPVSPPMSRHVTETYANMELEPFDAGWHNVTVTTIVKEIVGLPGWANNNSVGFKVVTAADVSRYITSFSYNSTLAAKLYVEYYSGSKTYPGPWDNGTLFNETDEGEMWEIWNGTILSGAIAGIVTRIEYLHDTDTTHDVDTTGNVFGNENKFGIVVDSNNYLYILAQDLTDSQLKLYRSTNGGDTWAILTTVITSASFYQSGICINTLGTVIHIAYAGQSATTRYYRNYTIATSTLGSQYTVFSGGSTGDTFAGIFYYNNYLYYFTAKNTAYGYYKRAIPGWTWTYNAIAAAEGSDMGDTNADAWIGPDGIEFYAQYKKRYTDSSYGRYIDHDGTVSAEQTITSKTLYGNGFTGISFNADTGQVLASYIENTNTKMWTRTRSAGPSGTWGSEVALKWKSLGYGCEYGGSWDDDNWFIPLTNSSTTKNKVYIYTPTGTLLHTYDIASADSQGAIPFVLGSEGTHYYQFHWYNCTWEAVYPTPTYPADPVEPEENIPDPGGLVYFDRFHMRLYLLIIGLGCFVSPPLLWAYGYADARTVLGGLISMALGIGLMMSITTI